MDPQSNDETYCMYNRDNLRLQKLQHFASPPSILARNLLTEALNSRHTLSKNGGNMGPSHYPGVAFYGESV
jgi:hypothetical protein